MAYEPLTIESFAAGFRAKPPVGINPTLWSDDDVVEWAELEPSFKTYFEPKINNPKPYLDGQGGTTLSSISSTTGLPNKENYMHDPSARLGEIVPNRAYIQDIEDLRASKDPEHLKYLGFNIEQMATDFGSWLSGNVFGYMEDPEGLAKTRTNALEILADNTKWLGFTGLYTKGLAKLSKGMELDKDSPEYNQARKSAREWYDISQAYIETGNQLAIQRMAESPELRGYFRWMHKNPMRHDNFYHAEQFQRSMAEMSPSVAAMLAATVATGGGALVAGATMFALEGSGLWAEGMRLYTEEGIPVTDENGKPVMEPDFITVQVEGRPQRVKNPKAGQQLKETMPFEEAAPIVGQTAIAYGAISAPFEAFQIGRATRLLKIGTATRRSFILSMFNKGVKKVPRTAGGIGHIADFTAEALEGGAVEWLQTVTNMTMMKALEEGYGNTPKQAISAVAERLGPLTFTKFMFSEEGGMSDDARQSFWLGLSGEAGMGALSGGGRRLPAATVATAGWAYRKARGRRPTTITERADFAVTPEGDAIPVPTAAEIVTESDFDPMTLVQTPGKVESALGYAAMLIGQVTRGNPYYASGVNSIISRAGGASDEEINKLINKDSKRGLEERPDQKAFNLLKELESEPEIRQQVLDIINQSPTLQAGVVAIDKDSVKNKLSQKDQGTATTTTPSEAVIDDINTDEWAENMDNIEELVNAKLEEQGLAKLQIKAEKKYEAEVDEDDVPAVSDEAEDIAAGKLMGLKGTDAQILTQYKKEIAKTEKKKPKKITPTKNINKESAPLQHLKNVQQQSGDAGVKAVLKGNKKKKIPQANLTTLNTLQNELFREEARLPVNTQNRGAIIEMIAAEVFTLAPKGAPTVLETAPHKRKVVKKKPVKAITKKKPITVEADAEDKAMAKSMGLSVEDYMKTIAASEKTSDKLTDEEAEAKLAKYLGEDKDVQFHGAIGSKDVHATIDGEKVELTDAQKERLRKIGLALDTGGNKAIIAQGVLGEFKAELIAQQAPAELDVKFSAVQGAAGQTLADSAAEETELVQSRIKGKNVVDLGSGKYLLEYRRDLIGAGAKRVAGVDPNFDSADHKQDMLTFLREQPDNSIDVITMNAMEFHPKSAIITGKDALKYQEEVFKEIDRTVKPGGSLMGSGTDFLDIPGWVKSEEAGITVYDKPSKKKKKREPLAAETADKLIDDIIGAPKVNAKTKRKLDSIQKESKTKADDAISKAEEIDSITDEMNDKLDEDLCI